MSEIILEGMEFFSYHGCFKEEQIIGNKFIVDLKIEVNTIKAQLSDNIHDTINYQKLYLIVKDEMEKKSHLLEHIARRIINSLYKTFINIEKITVKISKINPPLGGSIHNVSIIISE